MMGIRYVKANRVCRISDPFNTYNNITGDIVNTFNEGGLDPVTDWSGQGGGVMVTLPSSALTKPYQYMFQKVC